MARTKQTARKSTGGKAPRVLLAVARRNRSDVEDQARPNASAVIPHCSDESLPGLDAFNPIQSNLQPVFLGFKKPANAPGEEDYDECDDPSLVHSAMYEAQLRDFHLRANQVWRLTVAASDRPSERNDVIVPLCVLTTSAKERNEESIALKELYREGFISEEELSRRFAELSLAQSIAREPVIRTNATVVPSSPLNDSVSNPIERAIETGTVRVFVSSTFADMKEEREALIGQVFPALAVICKQRGLQFSAVDLRWGITTDQSQQGETINICLREIDRCQPYFIGILGSRYGWAQPPGRRDDSLLSRTFANAIPNHPWLSHFEDRSITELEIRHAVLNKPSSSAAKRAAFYFRQLDPREEQQQDARLIALKGEVQTSMARVSNYTSSSSLAAMVYADLLRQIEIDFPVKSIPHGLQRERQYQDQFMKTKSQHFIGGEAAFSMIESRLWDQALSSSYQPVCVTAPENGGKTAVLSAWTLAFREQHPNCHVVAHFAGASPTCSTLESSLNRIIEDIADQFGLEDPSFRLKVEKKSPILDLPELRSKLVDVIRAASQRGDLLLVCDGFERLPSVSLQGNPSVSDLQSWIPSILPDGVSIPIVAFPEVTLPKEFLLTNLSYLALRSEFVFSWRFASRRIRLPLPGEFTPNERLIFISEILGSVGKSLSTHQLSKITASQATLQPLYLKVLLRELQSYGSFENIDKHLEKLLTQEESVDLYTMMLQRLEDSLRPSMQSSGIFATAPEISPIGATLGMISFAPNVGITEEEILQITRIPQVIWSSLFAQVEDHLLSAGNMLFPANDDFAQAVKERYFDPSPSTLSFCKTLLIKFFTNDRSERKYQVICRIFVHLQDLESLATFITNPTNFHEMTKTALLKQELIHYWKMCQIQSLFDSASFVERLLAESLETFSSMDINSNEASETLEAMYRAGKFLRTLSLYELAAPIFDLCVGYRRKRLEKSPYDVSLKLELATAVNGFAYTYRLGGKYAQSLPLYLESLQIRKTYLPSSQKLASSINSLAILYRLMGRYTDAEPLYSTALEMRRSLLGALHKDVAQSLNSVGCLKQDMGENKAAEKFLKEALEQRLVLFGSLHSDVAMSYNNLASLYVSMGRYDDALQLYQKALEIYITIYGENHAGTAQTYNNIAGVKQELGAYEEAADMYDTALNIRRSVLGPMHPETASTINDSAALHLLQKHFDEAELLYREAMQIRLQALGDAHPDYAQSLNNLATLLRQVGQLDEALALFNKAANTYAVVFGENHPEVAQAMRGAASVIQLQGKYLFWQLVCPLSAIPLYNRALQIYIDTYGELHPEVAVILNDLGTLHASLQNWKKAAEHLERALFIHNAVLSGGNNPEAALILRNLGTVWEELHQPAKAKASFKRSYEVFESLFGASHNDTLESRHMYESVVDATIRDSR